jgi:hypothetical protein
MGMLINFNYVLRGSKVHELLERHDSYTYRHKSTFLTGLHLENQELLFSVNHRWQNWNKGK